MGKILGGNKKSNIHKVWKIRRSNLLAVADAATQTEISTTTITLTIICVNSNSDYMMRARGVLKGYKEIYISKIAKIGLNNDAEYKPNSITLAHGYKIKRR